MFLALSPVLLSKRLVHPDMNFGYERWNRRMWLDSLVTQKFHFRHARGFERTNHQISVYLFWIYIQVSRVWSIIRFDLTCCVWIWCRATEGLLAVSSAVLSFEGNLMSCVSFLFLCSTSTHAVTLSICLVSQWDSFWAGAFYLSSWCSSLISRRSGLLETSTVWRHHGWKHSAASETMTWSRLETLKLFAKRGGAQACLVSDDAAFFCSFFWGWLLSLTYAHLVLRFNSSAILLMIAEYHNWQR